MEVAEDAFSWPYLREMRPGEPLPSPGNTNGQSVHQPHETKSTLPDEHLCSLEAFPNRQSWWNRSVYRGSEARGKSARGDYDESLQVA